MKQRALPQSFWQQPNVANPQPPGVVVSQLPPLPLESGAGNPAGTSGPAVNGDAPSDMTPVEDVGREPDLGKRVDKVHISAANTDLLFSLFNSVEEEEAQRRIHVVRRGRCVSKFYGVVLSRNFATFLAMMIVFNR